MTRVAKMDRRIESGLDVWPEKDSYRPDSIRPDSKTASLLMTKQ